MNSITQKGGKDKLVLPPPQPTRVGNRVYFDPNRHPVLHASNVALDMEAGVARLNSRAVFSVGKFVDGNHTFSVPVTAMMRRHARAAYHTAFLQYGQAVCILVALHTLTKVKVYKPFLLPRHPFRRAIESLRMFKIPQIDWICNAGEIEYRLESDPYSNVVKLKTGEVVDLTPRREAIGEDLPF